MSILLERYLSTPIRKDISKKMVFISGPRQVGKTSLAQSYIKNYKDGHAAYLNWDRTEHRKRILNEGWPRSEELLIFDEIHKFKRWKSFVKGLYDTMKNTHQFIITGSARLDHYRKGGDSMLGRYYHYRLHPLSLGELGHTRDNLEKLYRWGGFPECFLEQDESFQNRWHLQRLERLIREDLRDLENIRDISLIEMLAEALPERVGSPLSVRNLALDLEIDPKTCKRWIEILENLYYCYRISPFGISKLKTVKHEKKLYMWDWTQVPSEGGYRFENMVAGHLLKYCHFMEDTKGIRHELRYIRGEDKREVDFIVLKNKKPLFAVECKTGERELSPYIRYLEARTKIPKFYQVHRGRKQQSYSERIELLPFEVLSEKLGLV